jgi:hypothetical protein
MLQHDIPRLAKLHTPLSVMQRLFSGIIKPASKVSPPCSPLEIILVRYATPKVVGLPVTGHVARVLRHFSLLTLRCIRILHSIENNCGIQKIKPALCSIGKLEKQRQLLSSSSVRGRGDTLLVRLDKCKKSGEIQGLLQSL